MKKTLTIADLTRSITNESFPSLKDLDSLMAVAKETCPAEDFPELKLSKTYRFTCNVLREYGIDALDIGEFDEEIAPYSTFMNAYIDLRAMLDHHHYMVDETFATVLRSLLYKMRTALKEIAEFNRAHRK